MKTIVKILLITSLLALLTCASYAAEKPYEGITINVIAQPRPEWDLIQKDIPTLEQETGMKVNIRYFDELERRSKERLDASMGTGSYQVYYLDEANIPEFGNAGWVYPIKDYFPEKYDFNDFFPSYVSILSWKDIPYAAPVVGAGDWLMYRKDLFQENGFTAPKTFDEWMAIIKKFNEKAPDMYGTATRGLRGSGMNVWRWTPTLYSFGGKYLNEKDEPVFNSPEAVKATEFYIELIKNSPPGCATFSWSDCIEAFRSGKVATFWDTVVFLTFCEDPQKSQIAGKTGYITCPAGPGGAFSSGFSHGIGISVPGCKDEKVRKAAGEFIGWFTSKENEIKRIVNKASAEVVMRASSMGSPEFTEFAKSFPEAVAAIKEANKITKMLIMQKPEWPEIGDNLGIILEELFAGTKTDIKASLDEAVNFAKDVFAKSAKK